MAEVVGLQDGGRQGVGGEAKRQGAAVMLAAVEESGTEERSGNGAALLPGRLLCRLPRRDEQFIHGETTFLGVEQAEAAGGAAVLLREGQPAGIAQEGVRQGRGAGLRQGLRGEGLQCVAVGVGGGANADARRRSGERRLAEVAAAQEGQAVRLLELGPEEDRFQVVTVGEVGVVQDEEASGGALQGEAAEGLEQRRQLAAEWLDRRELEVEAEVAPVGRPSR